MDPDNRPYTMTKAEILEEPWVVIEDDYVGFEFEYADPADEFRCCNWFEDCENASVKVLAKER